MELATTQDGGGDGGTDSSGTVGVNHFQVLFDKCLPHILETIFLSLDPQVIFLKTHLRSSISKSDKETQNNVIENKLKLSKCTSSWQKMLSSWFS